MLDLRKIYQLNEKIVLRKIDNKCWALNIENGNQYRLNEVAYFILDLFREPVSVEAIVSVVGNEYAVDRERLIADCSSMVQYAVDKNILKEG
ncbi:MAG: PqqD family protein [Phascolarctobacterium sp.]|nr:PqqD family protein [Phascolarctobacterium sp.]